MTSAMVKMSRAIRGVLNEYAPTLDALPPDALTELTQITGAFYFDLKAELDRRGGPYDTPESVKQKVEGARMAEAKAAEHLGLTPPERT